MRFGVTENLYGIDEIAAFRKCRSACEPGAYGPPPRHRHVRQRLRQRHAGVRAQRKRKNDLWAARARSGCACPKAGESSPRTYLSPVASRSKFPFFLLRLPALPCRMRASLGDRGPRFDRLRPYKKSCKKMVLPLLKVKEFVSRLGPKRTFEESARDPWRIF